MDEEPRPLRRVGFSPQGLPHCELDKELRRRLNEALGEEEVRVWLRDHAQRPPRDTVLVVHSGDVEAAAEELRGCLPSVSVRSHGVLPHVLLLEASDVKETDRGPWEIRHDEGVSEVIVDRRCAEAVLRPV